ncbi:MAG: hypothetical protein ACOYXB_12580 [Bacteroidota bacterium]
MRKIVFLLIISLCSVASGQVYLKEAGFRTGLTPGLLLRVNLEEELSYDMLLSFRGAGAQLHLIRQVNNELMYTRTGTLHLFYGFGAHAGFSFTDHYNILFRTIYFGQRVFSPLAGVDGYASVEYRLFDAPFSFGLDFKPYMEVSLSQIFTVNIWDFALTARYRF